MEENPFPDLHISPSGFLDTLETRQLCRYCQKSRKYYCYSCFTLLPSLVDKVPKLKLPYKIHIIKHPYEVCGKSTAVHAAVLAPDDVKIFVYPDIPDYKNSSKEVVLVCPGVNSISFQRYIQQWKTPRGTIETPADGPVTAGCRPSAIAEGSETGCNLETVVFIDSTWFQVHKILTDKRLADLEKIELESQETKFWRHQLDKPTTYLSTIEAIYYSLREYHEYCGESDYAGQYDDLLFFFLYFYRKIKALCDQGKTMKAYHCQRRKKTTKTAVNSN